MRAVAIDDVGTIVDTEMSQLAQVAAILAKEGLRPVGQMVLRAAFGTAMKRDDNKIRLCTQGLEHLLYLVQVEMLHRVLVMTEGTDTDFLSLAVHHRIFHTASHSGKGNPLFAQRLLGLLYARLSEVARMVVGHTHEIEAGILKPFGIAGRSAEGVTVGTRALRARSAFAESTFQIAQGQVGPSQNGLGIVKEQGTILLGQLYRRERSAHHHIANKGEGHRVVISARDSKCWHREASIYQ